VYIGEYVYKHLRLTAVLSAIVALAILGLRLAPSGGRNQIAACINIAQRLTGNIAPSSSATFTARTANCGLDPPM
jgi:hypothetical protein